MSEKVIHEVYTKCDRCGKPFNAIDIKNWEENPPKAIIDGEEWLIFHNYIDLCDGCSRGFKTWFSSELTYLT